jgi:hypothetical protein
MITQSDHRILRPSWSIGSWGPWNVRHSLPQKQGDEYRGWISVPHAAGLLGIQEGAVRDLFQEHLHGDCPLASQRVWDLLSHHGCKDFLEWVQRDVVPPEEGHTTVEHVSWLVQIIPEHLQEEVDSGWFNDGKIWGPGRLDPGPTRHTVTWKSLRGWLAGVGVTTPLDFLLLHSGVRRTFLRSFDDGTSPADLEQLLLPPTGDGTRQSTRKT